MRSVSYNETSILRFLTSIHVGPFLAALGEDNGNASHPRDNPGTGTAEAQILASISVDKVF